MLIEKSEDCLQYHSAISRAISEARKLQGFKVERLNGHGMSNPTVISLAASAVDAGVFSVDAAATGAEGTMAATV